MTTLTREEIQRLYGGSAYQVTDNDEVIIEADEFIGKLTGTADKAIALANPYNLKLIGDASGEITLNNTSKQMQVSVSHATNADNATHATSADNATRTTYCDLANLAHYAYRCSTALLANRSLVADNAITANSAIHADSADTAASANSATYDAVGNNIASTFSNHDGRITANATKNTEQDTRLSVLENYTEFKEWSSTTTYSKDKIVVYQDNLYRSKVNNNLNHIPTETDSQYWKLLSETAGGGTADCVHINDTETITGDKTFTGLLIANTQQQSDNSQKVATTSYVQSAVNTLATNVYTKTETYNKTETYSKTETNNLVIPKADNDSVVHLASAETITGKKTFSNGALLIMPQNPTANDVVNKDYVDNIATDLNGKADRSLSNVDNTGNILMAHNAMPSHTKDTLTLGASGTRYTAPADGYFTIHADIQPSGKIDLATVSATTGLYVLYQLIKGGPDYVNYGSYIPVIKGDSLQLVYEKIGVVYEFSFVYAVGSESEQQ